MMMIKIYQKTHDRLLVDIEDGGPENWRSGYECYEGFLKMKWSSLFG